MSAVRSTTPDMQQNPPLVPDALAIRRLAIPEAAPPYDDELASAEPRSGNRAAPGPLPDQACIQAASLHRAEDSDPGTAEAGPGLSTDSGHPGDARQEDHGGWPSRFAQVLAETLAGARPAQQLTPWTTEHTRRRIRQLGPILATHRQPRVRRIMTFAPSQDVLEMTVVVGFGSRVRVLALRLERGRAGPHRRGSGSGQWCCTEIESA